MIKYKQIILKNPKKKLIVDNEIQVLNSDIIGVGRCLEIDILKSMLKREKVRKITLILE